MNDTREKKNETNLHAFSRARCCRRNLDRMLHHIRHIHLVRQRRHRHTSHSNETAECLRAEVNHKVEHHDLIRYNHSH